VLREYHWLAYSTVNRFKAPHNAGFVFKRYLLSRLFSIVVDTGNGARATVSCSNETALSTLAYSGRPSASVRAIGKVRDRDCEAKPPPNPERLNPGSRKALRRDELNAIINKDAPEPPFRRQIVKGSPRTPECRTGRTAKAPVTARASEQRITSPNRRA
jgi:hypothetical protein